MKNKDNRDAIISLIFGWAVMVGLMLVVLATAEYI